MTGPGQPLTCSHPIYTDTLGCQACGQGIFFLLFFILMIFVTFIHCHAMSVINYIKWFISISISIDIICIACIPDQYAILQKTNQKDENLNSIKWLSSNDLKLLMEEQFMTTLPHVLLSKSHTRSLIHLNDKVTNQQPS